MNCKKKIKVMQDATVCTFYNNLYFKFSIIHDLIIFFSKNMFSALYQTLTQYLLSLNFLLRKLKILKTLHYHIDNAISSG